VYSEKKRKFSNFSAARTSRGYFALRVVRPNRESRLIFKKTC